MRKKTCQNHTLSKSVTIKPVLLFAKMENESISFTQRLTPIAHWMGVDLRTHFWRNARQSPTLQVGGAAETRERSF